MINAALSPFYFRAIKSPYRIRPHPIYTAATNRKVNFRENYVAYARMCSLTQQACNVMKYQAAIFDMDGLLLDTERVCMRIFQEACEVQNLPFYEDVYLSIIGRNAAGIETIFRKPTARI